MKKHIEAVSKENSPTVRGMFDPVHGRPIATFDRRRYPQRHAITERNEQRRTFPQSVRLRRRCVIWRNSLCCIVDPAAGSVQHNAFFLFIWGDLAIENPARWPFSAVRTYSGLRCTHLSCRRSECFWIEVHMAVRGPRAARSSAMEWLVLNRCEATCRNEPGSRTEPLFHHASDKFGKRDLATESCGLSRQAV